MPARKKPEDFPSKEDGAILHPYHLQQLNLTKFVNITNQFLQGQLSMQCSQKKSIVNQSSKFRDYITK